MSIVLLSTGGTIASVDDEEGTARPALTGEDLLETLSIPAKVNDLQTHEFSNVPSPHFTLDQMVSLVAEIQAYDADPTVSGIVVTQGTDVLEETAYFVDLCYNGSTPVVFTGAMRHASAPGADGPANLRSAILTVADDDARDRDVLVAFADRIFPAREATKMHSTAIDTFRAPEFGQLGVVQENTVTWRREHTNPDPTFEPEPAALTDDVWTVTATVDMSVRQIKAAQESTALCMATMGGGHVPPKILPDLETLCERGTPIVVTTRCPTGRVLRETYGFRGSETSLQEHGCYFSDLNLPKTRIRTIVALATDRMDEAFEKL